MLPDSTEQRILNRDESVYPVLMKQYWKIIWVICSSILKNVGTVQDIEECVADVFIELWKSPEKFNPQRGDIAVFLKTIARSRAKDVYRRLKPSLGTARFDEELGVG